MEGKNGKSSEAIAFNLFDMNNDGTITKHEMMNMSKNLTKEQVTNKGILALIFASGNNGIILGKSCFSKNRQRWRWKIGL